MKNIIICSGHPDWVDDRDLSDEDWVKDRWGNTVKDEIYE